jgi:hypothetical protein
MLRIFRLFRTKPGLDRDLAKSEMWEPGALHSLSMGVRHLRSGEVSYWWVSAAFNELVRASPGLPTMPVRSREFTDPADVQRTWEWVQETTARRSLHTPYIDEQLWCARDPGKTPSEAIDAALADAQNTLPGRLIELSTYSWEDDRTFSSGYNLDAVFEGRPGTDRGARALLFGTAGDPESRNEVREWAEATAHRLSVRVRHDS